MHAQHVGQSVSKHLLELILHEGPLSNRQQEGVLAHQQKCRCFLLPPTMAARLHHGNGFSICAHQLPSRASSMGLLVSLACVYMLKSTPAGEFNSWMKL